MSRELTLGALVMLFVATTAFVGVVTATGADEGKIAFLSGGNIHIINPDGTDEVTLTIGNMPLWSPDGKKFVYSDNYSLWVMNPDGTGKTKLADGLNPIWSPDGKKIVYSIAYSDNSYSLWVMSPDGTGKTKLADGESPVFSPDGKKILFHRRPLWKSGYYVINVDGTGKITLFQEDTDMDKPPWHLSMYPSWSPDGKILFVEETLKKNSEGTYRGAPCMFNSSINLVNIDGSDLIRLTGVTKVLGGCYRDTSYESPVFSPNEKKIAYIFTKGGCVVFDSSFECSNHGVFLYTMNTDGTNKTELVGELVGEKPIIEHLGGWSPDGKKLIYSTDKSVFVIGVDGTNKTELGGVPNPVWSPDGKKIAYEKGGTIYIANANDGSILNRLADGSNPQWSPVSFAKPTITPTPTSITTPIVTSTISPTEDAFNYQGEYTLDQTKLREEEKKVPPYVMKYAKEYKISPCLINGVIRQESDFFDYSQDPSRDKTKFDIGYMQVSHTAAIDRYKKYTGDEYKGTEEEWQKDGLDPDINIKYGTRYLRIQHERIKDGYYKDVYNDILKSTLSAYNAGHPTKDNSKYVDEVINGRDIIDGKRRGYEFFLTIRVPVGEVRTPEKGILGFEAIFAIVLLAVAYLLRRRK